MISSLESFIYSSDGEQTVSKITFEFKEQEIHSDEVNFLIFWFNTFHPRSVNEIRKNKRLIFHFVSQLWYIIWM